MTAGTREEHEMVDRLFRGIDYDRDDDDIRLEPDNEGDGSVPDSLGDLPQAPPDRDEAAAVRMPQLRKQGNTGVKAVLGDYNEAKDEDEFLRRYREQRLREMREQREAARGQRFGRLNCIRREQFVATVEGPGLFCVVHLTARDRRLSRRLDRVLGALARHLPHVHFASIEAQEARPGYDAVALPTVLVYRRGELHATVLRVHDEVGTRRFMVPHVVAMLHRLGVLSDEDVRDQQRAQRREDDEGTHGDGANADRRRRGGGDPFIGTDSDSDDDAGDELDAVLGDGGGGSSDEGGGFGGRRW